MVSISGAAGGAVTGGSIGAKFGGAPGAAIGALIGGGMGLFGNSRPQIPNVQPRKPNKLEQGTKTAMIYGPGDKYNLGLMDAVRSGSPNSQQPQNSQFPTNNIASDLRYRYSAQPTTPQGYGGMVVNPQYMTRMSSPQAPQEAPGKDFNTVGDGAGYGVYDDIMNGLYGANPSMKDIYADQQKAGNPAFDQQLNLMGVGNEAVNTGFLSGFEGVGDVNKIRDALTAMAGGSQDRTQSQVADLNNYIYGQNAVTNGLLGQSANEFGALDTSASRNRSIGYDNNAATIAGKAADTSFANATTGQNIASNALGDKDFIKNLLMQRFGQTDTLLGGINSGINNVDQGIVDDIYNQNVSNAEESVLAGRVGEKYNDLLLKAEQDAARRGLSSSSSAYVDAARKIETGRQQEYNDIVNNQLAQRSQNLLNALFAGRENSLKAADITSGGANTLASNIAPILNAASTGVGASNDAVKNAISSGALYSDLSKNALAEGNLNLQTGVARGTGLQSTAQASTQQQQVTQQGLASAIEAALKGDSTALAALQGAGSIGNDTIQNITALLGQGLESQAQGFNELLAQYNIGKGNRQDKTKLDIFNALADAGIGGQVA